MAIPQDILTGSIGVSATVTSILGYIQPALGILVALVTLVALGHSVVLKRKQIKSINKDLDDANIRAARVVPTGIAGATYWKAVWTGNRS